MTPASTLPRPLPPALQSRTVDGYGVPPGATFADLVGSDDDPTLFVFLRHYG